MRDDDHLLDGDDVPMPDSSELSAAMAEAFVAVLYDVGDNNDDVPFDLNVPSVNFDIVFAQDWDSAELNSEAFWVAYVLGAFQGGEDRDLDPSTDASVFGVTPGDGSGGSLIFIETIEDHTRTFGGDPDAWEKMTVVHEVGHAVAGSGLEPVTRYEVDQTEPILYRETYLRAIRTTDKPDSP